MRKLLIITFSILIGTLQTRADEGMWLPLLLKQLNEADMQSKGLKLSAEDIYSINKSSLKDAVVSFGGFCTGELISDQGLLLTNHHCGYGRIQKHSSLENDYLKNGFWAMSKDQELKNPGLTATFIVRMENVTDKIFAGTEALVGEARSKKIQNNLATIKSEAVSGTHYEAIIKPFYSGLEYYMFVTETFKDIRLVGAPPNSIGKFGGDTDNWMWPRHTGDFSVFRIYANKDNKPAEYSPENVPYKPKHHFPISLKGFNKGDFTMVFGFPGRTEEYLSSYGVEYLTEVSMPTKVKLRTAKLNIMNADMLASDHVRIKYAAKQSRVSNGWKKWQGAIRGLKKLDAIERKRELERKFRAWIKESEDRQARYGNLMDAFQKTYKEYSKYGYMRDYYYETLLTTEAIDLARRFRPLVDSLLSKDFSEDVKVSMVNSLQKRAEAHFKDYNAPTDERIFAALARMFYEDIDREFHPRTFDYIDSQYEANFEEFASEVYKSTIFADKEKVMAFLKDPNAKTAKKIKNETLYQIAIESIDTYRNKIDSAYQILDQTIMLLNKEYMAGLLEMEKDKTFYPDANSSLRLTYGKVDDYDPRDGVHYKYYTTLDGVIEKHDPNNEEFVLPKKLIELHDSKDYGQYGKNDTLFVCFTASNHTTGGNSGSPVLNGNGELIGTNFDRNWEGTMSDIMYDP